MGEKKHCPLSLNNWHICNKRENTMLAKNNREKVWTHW